MSRKPFFIFFLLGLCACRPGIPGNVLSPQKMQSAMWDMMRADEMASYYTQHDSSVVAMGKRAQFYGEVLRVQKITQEDFNRSLHFYENHPDLFKKVLDSLQSMGERFQKTGDTARKTFPPPIVPPDTSRPKNPARDSLQIKGRLLKKMRAHKKLITL